MTRFERIAISTELAILAVTLAITSITAWYLYDQTSQHFALERTTYMIERFNRDELVEARLATDQWLSRDDCKEVRRCAKDLIDKASGTPNNANAANNRELLLKSSSTEKKYADEPTPNDVFRQIRLFCNFFQELGTAAKHHTLDERYMWDVFGYNVSYYGERLKPFVEELRLRHQRPSLYQEFIQLIEKMKVLEKKYGQSTVTLA